MESTSGAWSHHFTEAEALYRETRLFESVQKINTCMELFERSLGFESGQILKDPAAFLREVSPTLSEEQTDSLASMYTLRADVLVGLGAGKRAGVDYTSALTLKPGDAQILEKQAKLRVAPTGGQMRGKVPCTILTGFLGSGKTTLLNHILQANHGKRLAVIENEFGEVGIDDALIQGGARTEEENIIEMNNGCVCCTVRGDLIAGLKKMIKSSRKSGKPLDGILIETTGLADPSPVAQTFFADDFVQQQLTLDGILTVVDAKHILQTLDEERPEDVVNEAVEQIAFADRILLNKCDLVDEATLAEVESRIRTINRAVPIQQTTNSIVEMNFILGIQAFSLDNILDQEDHFLSDEHEHEHDSRVTSVGIDTPGEVDEQKLNEWIGWLLRERGASIYRCKGVLAVKRSLEKYVFQAVHMQFKGSPQKPWAPGEQRRCRMIFIGKNLDREELTNGFMACMAP